LGPDDTQTDDPLQDLDKCWEILADAQAITNHCRKVCLSVPVEVAPTL
jgi:hypothetical protein